MFRKQKIKTCSKFRSRNMKKYVGNTEEICRYKVPQYISFDKINLSAIDH